MRATEEAAELVTLWQRVQDASVTGDARTLRRVRDRARSAREGAVDPREWERLAATAERHLEQLTARREEEPDAAVGDFDASMADALDEAVDEPVRRGRRGLQVFWLLLLLAYVVLQVVFGGGDGG